MSKQKNSKAEQLAAAKACAEGRIGIAEAARKLNIDRGSVREWVAQYKVHGEAAFKKSEKNQVYSEALNRNF